MSCRSASACVRRRMRERTCTTSWAVCRPAHDAASGAARSAARFGLASAMLAAQNRPMQRISKADALAVLRGVPLFSALSEEDRRGLLTDGRALRAEAGDVLVSAGEPADRFYVILRGRVKLYQLSPKGDEQILHLYGPGDTFGEAAVWMGQGYPAHAEAIEACALLLVMRDVLESAIRRRPEIALGMLAGLSLKLREFHRLIEQLALRDVPARLATALVDLIPKTTPAEGRPVVVLPQTKRELAAQIGTLPETLSRALARLSRSGLIAVEGRRIRILDPAGLRRLAQG
ncbi:MAG: cyclic nucleotide-binding domain-containing protein [Candidatus Eisenbacteria bacterium]|nr:cyclic nucleotide-binding domain-containing protein [Candidatus Eisenbacteria bacterium]